MAELFGLENGYNKKVLSSVLFACEEFEEPPFKLTTDIGWLWRGYLLAMDEASNQRAHTSNPTNTYYPPWMLDASKVIAQANYEMDNLAERNYATMQALLSVPDRLHGELQEIVNGLSLFSELRDVGKSHRYLCLVTAIVHACDLPTQLPTNATPTNEGDNHNYQT